MFFSAEMPIEQYMKHNNDDHKIFPGFPPEPVTNYWPYPKALNGWWHMLSGSEQKCLDYILRHTWGFKKDADYISLTQFERGVENLDSGTGLSLPSIVKALSRLEKSGFIKTVKKSGKTTHYELLKNFNRTTKDSLGTIKDLSIKGNNTIPSAPDSQKKTYKEEITSLIGYLSKKLGGVRFPNYGKQARAVKSMLDSGYSEDDIRWAVDSMLANTWWRENSFDMKNVADEIPKLMTRTFKEKKI